MTHRVFDLCRIARPPGRGLARPASDDQRHCRDRSDLYADGIRRGHLTRCKSSIAFIWSRTSARRLEALLIGRRPALRPPRSARRWRPPRPMALSPSCPCTGDAPGPQACGAAGGNRSGRPGTSAGSRSLRLCRRSGRRGAGGDHRAAAGHQPADRLRLPPARHAARPQASSVAAIRAGVHPVHALPDPPLAGHQGGQ